MSDVPSFPPLPVLDTLAVAHGAAAGVVVHEPLLTRAGQFNRVAARPGIPMTGDTSTRRAWLGRLAALFSASVAQQPDPEPVGRRAFTVTARKYEFDPEVIDVRRNDIVRLTITSPDIDHSFTIDAYRIQKRIPAGSSVTFEFRADEVGRFPFYCSMRIDPGCEAMRGELIVR